MDALVPLLVIAVAVWSRLGRRRRDDLGRAVAAFTARLREVTASASAPAPAPARPVRPAPLGSPPQASGEVPRAREHVRQEVAPAVAVVATDRAPVRPAAARARRRLDVRRDLVAAELLAPPLSLRTSHRPGGPAWR